MTRGHTLAAFYVRLVFMDVMSENVAVAQRFKILYKSVSMAVLFYFNLCCTVRAQGIVGAPPGTGIGDHWLYEGAQLYESWKFAPLISCFIASLLAALAAVLYFKDRKSSAVPMVLFFSAPGLTTALVTYVVNHLQDWYVAYQLSQYRH